MFILTHPVNFPVGGNRSARRKPATFGRVLTDSFRMSGALGSSNIEKVLSENRTRNLRVNTYRDITSVPTFFVRMLGKLLEFTRSSLVSNTQSKMADRLLNLPSICAVDHFWPGRVKKSGYMKMSLFNVQLHLYMIYPLCCSLGKRRAL